MEPAIVHLIVCDDVATDPSNHHRLNIHGLLIRLWTESDPPFPLIRSELSVLAVFLGGQGIYDLSVRVVSAATNQTLFGSPLRRARMVGPPDSICGVQFRLRGCKFPSAGLYWVECLIGTTVIDRQRLWVLKRGVGP